MMFGENSNLNIEVEDCGPIAKAKFDLRPLSVFIGPSNTGKSYLAIMIYALHRHFTGATPGPRGIRYPSPRLMLPPFDSEDGPRQDLLEKSTDQIRKQLQEKLTDDSDNQVITLTSGITEMFGMGMEQLGVNLRQEIQRCFGFDDGMKSLIRRGCRTSRISITKRIKGVTTDFQQDVRLSAKKPAVNVSIPSDFPLTLSRTTIQNLVKMHPTFSSDEKRYENYFLANNLFNITQSRLVSPLNKFAYYLPADRTGIMHAHKVVVGSLLASAPMGGILEINRTSTLSGVISDFLEQLIYIENPRLPRHRRRKSSDLGKEIEDKILYGNIEVSRSAIDYPDFFYRPNKWTGRKKPIPLMNASSMVSELAPVVLYLRHLIGHGDILIVEEPESHLHPAMQVEFTKQLASLVNAGVRIIVTTHSEWLLEELANIVRRSRGRESQDQHHRNGEFVSLRQEEVGAWLFEPKKKPLGSVVKEIQLDEAGLFPTGFEDVAAALHNESSRISWHIESNL